MEFKLTGRLNSDHSLKVYIHIYNYVRIESTTFWPMSYSLQAVYTCIAVLLARFVEFYSRAVYELQAVRKELPLYFIHQTVNFANVA